MRADQPERRLASPIVKVCGTAKPYHKSVKVASVRALRRFQRRPAPRDRGRVDDRGRRLTVRREVVEDVLELVDRPQVEPHQVAVLAGDAVALADRRCLGRNLADPLELSWRRPDAYDGRHRVAERPRVELRAVA